MIITIDGPSGSGKSTVAHAIAKKNGWYYLNSGFLYRAVAWQCMRDNLSREQVAHLDSERIERYTDPKIFTYEYRDGIVRVLINGQDITGELKTPIMDIYASQVSKIVLVRERLLDIQKLYAQNYTIVAEGRDMGTVVFPEAQFKFFITATLTERARRWQILQKKAGIVVSHEQAEKDLSVRDAHDTQRTNSPLKAANDAHVIDTTNLTVNQVIDRVMEYIRAYTKILGSSSTRPE